MALSINCTKCGLIKPESEFYKNPRLPGRGFLCCWCKDCMNESRRAWRNSSPETIVKCRARSKQWRINNPEKSSRGIRCATLRKKYGISADDYDEILSKQGGVCAICGADNPRINQPGKKTIYLHVDHNHKTNKVRGLLCQPCNTSLGQMGDSPERLRRAAQYLEGK